MHLSIRDSVSTDAVIATIKCKELEFKLESKSSGSGEILFSKGKSNHFKRNKFTKGQRFHKQKLLSAIIVKGSYQKKLAKEEKKGL